ncbi:hypothetical protein SH1V18_15410 [Vallitalea longa]|uniref:KAP NTPase domain-containing protein n=1 Tax=Vallitalea longa TaxID=2936439 RepID=A0A9W5YAD8_9FIRM|nr:P-loop NTPase fold protein [Vallitalea longa]GKX29061.1 hypothetical protein SH1V18_15410 [Vallitalea longa]
MSKKYTFKDDDIFKRKILGDQLAKIIHKSEELRDDSFVIAIDGSWGVGKSIFLDQFKNEIENPHEELYKSLNANVVYYNAWENDDLDDAFTPLAYHIYNTFKMQQIEENLKKEILNQFKDLSKQIASSVLKSYVQKIGIDDKIYNRIKQVFSKGKKIISEATVIPPSFEDIEKHNILKKKLKDVIQNAIKSNNNNKLIIIIDELDRCRPTFAIETLEIIKHYFGINNVIFILGLDFEQLSYSIATIYGQKMDATGYLIRFVDVIMKIPTPDNIRDYIIQKTYLNDYINEIVDVVSFYNMSIRDINKFLINIQLFYEYNDNKKFLIEAFKSYIYLIAVKLKHSIEFKRLLTDDLTDDYNKLVKIFPETIWTSTFCDLISGRNKTTVQIIVNNPTAYEVEFRYLIDQNDISDNNTKNILLPIGQYIFNKIEMCVLDNNIQIL